MNQQEPNRYGDVYAFDAASIHQGDNINNFFLSCQDKEERDREPARNRVEMN